MSKSDYIKNQNYNMLKSGFSLVSFLFNAFITIYCLKNDIYSKLWNNLIKTHYNTTSTILFFLL